MQFRATGEIWSVDAFVANGEGGDRFFADAAISHAFNFIRTNLPVLLAQGAKAPIEIIVGVSDLRGLHWASETRWGGFPSRSTMMSRQRSRSTELIRMRGSTRSCRPGARSPLRSVSILRRATYSYDKWAEDDQGSASLS